MFRGATTLIMTKPKREDDVTIPNSPVASQVFDTADNSGILKGAAVGTKINPRIEQKTIPTTLA
jgi:hypothetical protein